MSPLRVQPRKDAMSEEIHKPAEKGMTCKDEDVKRGMHKERIVDCCDGDVRERERDEDGRILRCRERRYRTRYKRPGTERS